MGYVLRLKKGVQVLDLSSGNYAVDQWVPPRANIISNVAHGTSANRYGGGVKVSERAVNTSTVFSVRIIAQSNAEVEYCARNIEEFLREAGNEAEPMYLEWRPDNILTSEPYWGQLGAYRRYEVVSGRVDRWSGYFMAELRSQAMYVNVMLELKPFAHGKRQKLMTAKGGIWENTLGLTTGESRGVNLSYDCTNLCTNPVFGNATYDTGWSASGSLTVTENTDPEYILFGDTSARMETTADDQYFEQGIAMTNGTTYTVSCYIKMRDSSTPTTDQIKIRIIGGGTPSFRELGNGWWLAYRSYAATADDTFACGLQIMSDVITYFGGMQVESRSIPSPMAYGDMLGCTWASTAHASTTYRSDPMLRMAANDLLYKNGFTIRFVWTPDFDSSFGTDCYFFDSTGANEIQASIASGVVTFNVGAVSLACTGQTFSVGDVIVVHFVATPGRVQVFWNGSSIGSTGSYDIPYPSTYMYVGSDDSLASPINGTILGLTTFDWGFTSTEADNDYDNVYQSATSFAGVGRRVDAIPYLWTKDGDDVVDNHNDSGEDNFCVIGGIPGTANAETEYRIAMSNIAARQAIIGIMTHDYDRFVKPSDYLYGEQDGTVDAGSSNGEYYTKSSVSTSTTLIGPSSTTLSQRGVEALLGRDIYMVARLYDASASTLQLAVYRPGFYSGSVYEWHNNTMPATTWGLHRTDAISLPTKAELFQTLVYSERSISNKAFGLYGRHVSGTSDVRIDFWAIMPRPMAILGDGDAVSGAGWVLNGRKIINMDSTFATLYKRAAISGDTLDLFPNQYNVLLSHLGYGSDADITRTLTYSVYITPRWSLA